MPEGVIAGGWSYVAAAYGITALVLVFYVWSLSMRGRSTAEGRALRGGGPSTDRLDRAQSPPPPARPGPTTASDREGSVAHVGGALHDD